MVACLSRAWFPVFISCKAPASHTRQLGRAKESLRACAGRRCRSSCAELGLPSTHEAVFCQRQFTDLFLDARLLQGAEVLVGAGARLTWVQDAVFRLLLDSSRAPGSSQVGPDLLLRAPTGTGKSLAFLLPALVKLLESRSNVTGSSRCEGVRSLVLAPTRELVLQLSNVARGLLQYTNAEVRSSFLAGGFSLAEDIERLRADSPQLLISTPGRLVQHLRGTPNFVRALGSVQLLVLDEADRLLDPTFVHQIDYVVRCLPSVPKPQTVLCSATFSAPVRRFALRALRAEYRTVDVGEGGGPADVGVSPTAREPSNVIERVSQSVIRYEPEGFVAVLLATLGRELHSDASGDCKRVLVLFPTVKWLQFFYVLLKHRAGIPQLWALHSRLSDDKRRTRVSLFSRGTAVHGVLFASDLAARGIDFDVHAVVQVGPPADREQYVHRAGRTGRLTASGRSLLLLHPLEADTVLQGLQGLQVHEEEPPPLEQEASSFEGSAVSLTHTPAVALARLPGWWEDRQLAASGDMFFSGFISFYLERREQFRLATPDSVVRIAAGIMKSTGFPIEQGLPAISPGLARRIHAEEPLCGVRAASVRERWDKLVALSPSRTGSE